MRQCSTKFHASYQVFVRTAEIVVTGVRMVGVEASHCYNATGIRPGLRLLGLMVNRVSYRHCVTGGHYPEYRKMSPIKTWEMDLILMTKSVEINSNISFLDEWPS
jgi:hypothetical protein